MLEVPPVVRNKAHAVGADEWLVRLPELVRSLEADWGVRAGRAYGDATEAYVAEAIDADGAPSVVKVLIPRSADAAVREISVLRAADGDGCVRLLRHDVDRGALLMERLGPSMFRLGVPIGERHRILCDTAARLWRPAGDLDLPSGADTASRLTDHILSTWEDLDRPCSSRVVDDAVECAERRRRAHDIERARLVHGDVHQWNALRTPDGFTLIDPDGLLAEPEYDLGIIMREDPVELMAAVDPMARARWLAARTGTDATAIWEWGVVERVSTGLLATKIGLEPAGHEMLAAAEYVARVQPGSV